MLPRKSDPEVACLKWAYWHRHLVENLWTRRKEWRAAATCQYEKAATFFLFVILIAITIGAGLIGIQLVHPHVPLTGMSTLERGNVMHSACDYSAGYFQIIS
ncbi:hypothetical protein KTQ54_07510 [Komagataeibacter oboediens]|uniref:hypothetical protein n=1 Tax=Komagataeibacter oboediens TaxID=65958 RepID=UPI001C2B8928|nr:hypothetical protein [Komagataeibacter oboediens]MBV0888384.1 hypothetical protein [Komagataeibacter oboediens]MCK9820279.1 hypothetical protein [Komagataeibacter oboediens]